MTRQTQRGLFIFTALALVAAALALIFTALEEQVDFFKTPKEVTASDIGKALRIGGYVEKNSLQQKGVKIYFTITDFDKKIQVRYEGIVPDLFREGQGVIAEGKLLNAREFVADRILAKHDENYRPPALQGGNYRPEQTP